MFDLTSGTGAPDAPGRSLHPLVFLPLVKDLSKGGPARLVPANQQRLPVNRCYLTTKHWQTNAKYWSMFRHIVINCYKAQHRVLVAGWTPEKPDGCSTRFVCYLSLKMLKYPSYLVHTWPATTAGKAERWKCSARCPSTFPILHITAVSLCV